MDKYVTFEDVKNNEEISAYIKKADETLASIGYTEHSFSHVTRVATQAAHILTALGYDERRVELSRIAGYMHDIGNVVNRADHAQSGAVMAFRILDKMGMSACEIADTICAIGNHDEATGAPVNEIAAAIILGDKTDVRRSRVREPIIRPFDQHDRVNYAVTKACVALNKEEKEISLHLSIDTTQCSVMDYFEIFLSRMLMCKRAAQYLSLHFRLIINGVSM